MKHRSQLGGDVTDNLITLCSSCHRKRHGWRR
jgi:5-methylcytosine-specific restriction endonuclease McrA